MAHAIGPFTWYEDLDKPTMDNIFKFFWLSPGCHDNGIACCSRRTNILWRYKHYRALKGMVDDARAHRGAFDHVLFLCDLDDVL